MRLLRLKTNKNLHSSPGFTLVELLVVISILAILSAVGVVVFRGVTANARDSVRIRDLQSIKQALELYRSDVHNYPITADFVLTTTATLSFGSNTYLSPVPQDVDSSKNYFYSASSDDSSFILCAKKEGNMADFSDCTSLNECGSAGNCDIGISSE